MQTKGILIALDAHIEWMFPWFVQKLEKHSSLPLFVVDLGISPNKRALWDKRFTIVTLDRKSLALPDDHQGDTEVWQKAYAGNYAIGRIARLLKPFALALTPFDTTLWLDLDCEVRGPISSLFDYAKPPWGLSMALEREASHRRSLELGLLSPGEQLYNSGVIVYERRSPLLTLWQEATLTGGEHFIGDQELFSRLLFEKAIKLDPFPSRYNWRMADGDSEEAQIVHWVGDGGKRHILEELLLGLRA